MNTKRNCGGALIGDSLVEIFERVGSKDLAKLKLVCSEWEYLISGLELRRLRRLLQPLILGYSERHPMRYFSFSLTRAGKRMIPFNFTHPDAVSIGPKILDSHRGLLLLQYSEHDFYIYDPSTQKSRKFNLTHTAKYPNLCMLKLVFDPSKEFNLICIRCCEGGIKIQAEVYDSLSGCWKLQYEGFKPCRGICVLKTWDYNWDSTPKRTQRWVYCNNKIYGEVTYLPYEYAGRAFSLDIHTSDFTVFDFPPSSLVVGEDFIIRQHRCEHRFQESNGHIYCIKLEIRAKYKKELIGLWELQSDHSWSFMYGDIIDDVCIEDLDDFDNPLKLMIGSDHCCLLISRGPNLWLYNFLDKTFNKILQLEGHPYFFELPETTDVHQLVQTSLPV